MLDRASRNLLACGGAAFTMRHKIHKWVLQNIRLVILRHGRSSLVHSFIEDFLFSAYMIHTYKVNLWSVVPVFDHQRWRQIGDVIIANLTQIMTSGVNKSLTWTSVQIFSAKIASFCLKKKQARVGDWFWEIKNIEIGNNKTTNGVKIFSLLKVDDAMRNSLNWKTKW